MGHYNYYTQPPLWLDRVQGAVSRRSNGEYTPGLDPGDPAGRLLLHQFVLSPDNQVLEGENAPRDLIELAETHFDMLKQQGIRVPQGREYFIDQPQHRMYSRLVSRSASVDGMRLDVTTEWGRPVELDVAIDNAAEAFEDYYKKIEADGLKWMLASGVMSLGRLSFGKTVYMTKPQLYLRDLTPCLTNVTPERLSHAKKRAKTLNHPRPS
ncbi:MAG TPA: hypothetical protein VF733_02250 [Candidatus Saccharimonadales bacterium]